MSSRLGRPAVQTIASLAQIQQALPGSNKVRTGGPWGGYIPDVNPQLLDQRAFQHVQGLVPAGEKLTCPPGWQVFEDEDGTAVLPLGGVTHAFGTDAGQPVKAMGRLAPLAGQAEENLAVTADNGTTDGTLFRFGALGVWEEMASGTVVGMTANAETAMQSCVYPLASTVSGKRGIYIWTNGFGVTQGIWYYPSVANTYNLLPVPSSDPYDYTPFQCRSVAANLERVYFGDTSEDAVRYPQRVRWTIPSWTSVSADNLGALTNVGMGAIDFTEFKGRLVKVLPLNNGVACYFTDGVGMLENTFNTQAPHKKRVVTRLRGLLGDNACIDLGGGLHFGLFTDGWFFFDGENWKEAGVTDLNGAATHRWLTTFYSLLNADYAHQIALGYDEVRHFIHIAFPANRNATENNTYWIYDVRGDRVWPQPVTAGTSAGESRQVPTAFSEYRQVLASGLTWATATGTWASAGANPWSSGDADLGQLRLCHGTGTGQIWQHEPSIYTRGTIAPEWQLRSSTDFGDPYREKSWLRRAVEYIGVENPAPTLSYSVYADHDPSVVKTGAVDLKTESGRASSRRVSRLEVHASGASMRMEMAGTHPTILLGWEDEVVGTTGEADRG